MSSGKQILFVDKSLKAFSSAMTLYSTPFVLLLKESNFFRRRQKSEGGLRRLRAGVPFIDIVRIGLDYDFYEGFRVASLRKEIANTPLFLLCAVIV